MASIDRADWHYGGDYPTNLPKENSSTHIGMYLTWIIDNELIGSIHLEHSIKGIEAVKKRQITGRDFFFKHCDEKFTAEDLNDIGRDFTGFYYENPDDPDATYGQYILDYEKALGSRVSDLYEVVNSWDNYKKIARIIDRRYKRWLSRDNGKSRLFWKK